MLNNYDATLKDLARYLVDFAPAGAERDVSRLNAQLAEGNLSDYIALEFRPTPDAGASLYVRMEGANGRYERARIMDDEGNRWYSYVVKCEVSWGSWGSDNVATCQRRLAVMSEVTRFAAEVERVFGGVFYRLDATAAEIKAEERKYAKQRAEEAIRDAVLKNVKGVKVGQSKSVLLPDGLDVTGIGELQVERKEGGRNFKYSVTVERAGTQNLAWFMRIDV